MLGKFVDVLKLEHFDYKNHKDYHFRLNIFNYENDKNFCVDVTPLRVHPLFDGSIKLYGVRYIRLNQHVSNKGRIYYTLAYPKLYKGYIKTVSELLSL